MLSKTIQTTIKTFITAAAETAKITEKKAQEMAAQRMYSAEYLTAEKAKIDEAGAAALGLLREKAIKELTAAFANARAAIENSVAESAHTTEIEELKNILEASGRNLSEFETSVILDKVAGSYWGLKMLNNAVADASDAKKILSEKFTAPDPVYYMQLFDEEEAALVAFVGTYDGKEVTPDTQGQASGEILLNGDHFENFHKRIMINPYYITDDDLEVPSLRPAERRTLRKSNIVLDTSDKASKQLVIKAAHTGGTLRNMLIRTCWADTIKAEEKKMWEEAQDNAQIKYKGAWRDVAGAVGKSGF